MYIVTLVIKIPPRDLVAEKRSGRMYYWSKMWQASIKMTSERSSLITNMPYFPLPVITAMTSSRLIERADIRFSGFPKALRQWVLREASS